MPTGWPDVFWVVFLHADSLQKILFKITSNHFSSDLDLFCLCMRVHMHAYVCVCACMGACVCVHLTLPFSLHHLSFDRSPHPRKTRIRKICAFRTTLDVAWKWGRQREFWNFNSHWKNPTRPYQSTLSCLQCGPYPSPKTFLHGIQLAFIFMWIRTKLFDLLIFLKHHTSQPLSPQHNSPHPQGEILRKRDIERSNVRLRASNLQIFSKSDIPCDIGHVFVSNWLVRKLVAINDIVVEKIPE